ncbi:hypothetical protein PRIPAC_89194, partial [Pristionchus pacificus]|uniref:Uncharacterized protein n=1 Tax=Pristionchus pacificus TaxID=54126 RepID=A0A2A6B613_PRIPA
MGSERIRDRKRGIDRGLWKFYTEDSTGLKIGPVPAPVMSLVFIASLLLKGKARDKIRWYEGETKKMGLVLGIVISTLHSYHAFNWTSCFYEPPVAPAVDPSTVDVPAVLYAARDALNNPGLATGKVAHDVTLELLNGRSDFPSLFPPSPFFYFHSVAGGDEEMRECTPAMDAKPSGLASKEKIKDDSTQAERHNRMMERQSELKMDKFRFALMKENTILAWIFRHFKIKSSERRFEMRTKMERIMRPQKGKILVTFGPHLKT